MCVSVFDPKLPNNTGCFCPVTFLRVRLNRAIKRCRPDGGIYANCGLDRETGYFATAVSPVRLNSHHLLENRQFVAELTKIRGKKAAKGKAKLMLSEPVFVDLQGSNLRFQSRGRNAEPGCGTR